jgi:hypothetical protein
MVVLDLSQAFQVLQFNMLVAVVALLQILLA